MGAAASITIEDQIPLRKAIALLDSDLSMSEERKGVLQSLLPDLCSITSKPDAEPEILTSTLLRLKEHAFVDLSFDRSKSLINSPYESSAIWTLLSSPPFADSKPPNYDDIVQGHNGDCFLVASIAALLAAKGDLETETITDVGNSKFEVKVFSEGSSTGSPTIVDGLIPTQEDGSAIFASSRNGDMSCFALIEKAFAKFEGGGEFWRLKGGNVAECLYSLTGVGCEDLHDPKNFKGLILENFNNNNPMGTGHVDTKEKGDNARTTCNIRKNHAYAVVGADNSCVKIYNPHGNDDNFKGKKGGDGKGTLTLSWEEFSKTMNRLQVCPLHNSNQWSARWSKETAGGCSNFPTFRKNDVLIIDADTIKTGLTLMMGTQDVRASRSIGQSVSYPEIGITLVQLTHEGSHSDEDFFALTPERYKVFKKTCSFANKRETVLTLSPSEVGNVQLEECSFPSRPLFKMARRPWKFY
ncbi:hypothetical protein TrST_g10357 [Triparma strigata]|uniref:Calpain catalytic domain-containing protein n=1 Tax=Triparma strigata TaxID=1606541 RepID=A0A9W7B4U7_9STRA|nr:hypothetical protein TrST_g10357 [Triparma strigata]